MLALNRYRLKHLVKRKHLGAMRASKLLERPDRLIGVILIGNNFVNIFATIIAAEITRRIFGEWAALTILPFALTIIILIFAEVTPKSIAAFYPEKIAFTASFIISPLLMLLFPVVWSVNVISNSLAKLFGLDTSVPNFTEHLRPEELRTVVDEAGALIPDQHQGMLLNVLDLEKATVEDIMVPRNEIIGIDIHNDIDNIINILKNTDYTRLPVYEGDINNIIGLLHLRNITKMMCDNKNINHAVIRNNVVKPYFIPESTPLPTQLLNFQKEKRRTAIVVDEYGEVQGLATLLDLLEEIVGDFVTDAAEEREEDIIELDGNWFLIDASASIRDINRHLGWQLSTQGPKTVNGLIVEYLESIPDAVVSFQIQNYRFEITQLSETRIEKAKVIRI